MSERIIRRDTKTFLSFLFAFAILYLLITRANLRETAEIIRGTEPLIYGLAVLYLIPAYLLRGYRWKKLLENIGFFGKVKDLTEILVLSFFVNCIVPAKLGDVYRGYLMKKNYQQPISKVLGTVFAERSIDTIGITVMFLLAAFWSFKVIPGDVIQLMEIGVIITLLFVVLLVLLKYQDKRIAKFMPNRAGQVVLGFGEGASNSLRRSSLPIIVVVTVLLWLLEGGRIFLVMKSIDVTLPISVALFVALASALATAFPFTPAGLGAVELAMAGLLILVGLDKEVAISIALLDRLISYWGILLSGGIIYAASNKT
jgi:hypothetical protein